MGLPHTTCHRGGDKFPPPHQGRVQSFFLQEYSLLPARQRTQHDGPAVPERENEQLESMNQNTNERQVHGLGLALTAQTVKVSEQWPLAETKCVALLQQLQHNCCVAKQYSLAVQ